MPERTLGDVLTCISAPRWHLLSWVLDWPTLQDRCSGLLKDPESRLPGGIKRELKYLVIDYTQFEEWSSEEEILFNNGESQSHTFLVWTILDILGAVSGPKSETTNFLVKYKLKREQTASQK